MDERTLKALQHIFGDDQVVVIDEDSFPEQDGADEEGDVKKAFWTIIAYRGKPAVNYAVNYARAGISMTGRDLRTQVLYVLNNISHWRGPIATEVRQTLKKFAGVK
jgi:hypothetical protein